MVEPTGMIPLENNFTPAPMLPSLPVSVELGLTITFIALYGFLFGLVYVQLLLILWYRHRRFSYQTVFLFTCLVWALLRVTLFSFYINDTVEVDELDVFCYWILFCFPVCLQFIILSLLVLYFAQVLYKLKARVLSENYKKRIRKVRIVVAVMVAMFFTMNLTCAVLSRLYEDSMAVVRSRVLISGALFISAAGFLAHVVWKLAKLRSVGSTPLELRGATVCQAATTCVVIILLYLSRTVYNCIAIATACPSFGYSWINVSDQADMIDTLKGLRYVSFGIVLFVWEFLPTFIVIIFFRVRKFASTSSEPEDATSQKVPARTYFFDNPRRYDSDDDLARTHSSTNGTPRDYNNGLDPFMTIPINETPHVGYGTIIRSSSYPTGYGIPGTTPPMLFAGIPGNASISGYQPQHGHV